MTAQIGEIIIYKGEKMRMETKPLEEYLKTRWDIRFESVSTACWRGYYGTWEIKQNKLYLIDLKAFIGLRPYYIRRESFIRRNSFIRMNEKMKEVGLDYLFPEQNEVFASWFTGEIQISMEERLKSSIYEKDLILTFKEGIFINEREINNHETVKKYDIRLLFKEN